MIFDALRHVASNWLPDIKPMLDSALLLHFPVTPHEVLPRQQDLETMSAMSVNFRLPHSVTAVEDNASCILLIDPKPDLRGLAEQRLFIECVPMDNDENRYNDTPFDRAMCESFKGLSASGVYTVSFGEISCPAQRAGTWMAMGELLWVMTGTVSQQHTTAADFRAIPEAASTAMLQAALRNVMTAIEEIIAMGGAALPHADGRRMK